eukprot:CAMPEP_0119430390 /NCGR_PEP_ID=MMETSP1335-20130426/43982_1 /TAXON_ID=259385 /ORGANISM="Chrysoculter rhomboideus, Strain RCC1486" /LENGTH=114 /DNA_ID=CAMNT_0007456149 /DNA_START=74 /DNA_END=415 /DNA_ORIENTATION=+
MARLTPVRRAIGVAHRDRHHPRAVPGERLRALARAEVPQPHGAVLGAGHEPGERRERHHFLRVPFERAQVEHREAPAPRAAVLLGGAQDAEDATGAILTARDHHVRARDVDERV